MASSSATLSLSCTTFPRRASPSLSFSAVNSSSLFNNAFFVQSKANHDLVLCRTRARRGFSCNCLFGLGLPEIVVIAGVVTLVFAPKKLPEVGRSIGKTVKSFQQAAKEFEAELKKESDSLNESAVEKPTAANEEENGKLDVKL